MEHIMEYIAKLPLSKLSIIVLIIFAAIFLLFVFKLGKKNPETDKTNSYGVNKANGADKKFKRASIIMAIVAVVCGCLCCFNVYAKEYAYAKKRYDMDIEQYENYMIAALCLESDAPEESARFRELAEIYWNPSKNFKDCWRKNKKARMECIYEFCLLGWFGLFFALYMFPSKVARKKSHEQTTAIVWINAILGCTIVLWIAMLIWANSSSKKSDSNQISLTDELNEIQKLKEQGLITEEEFEEKKKQILGI
jgi:protein-S-isoprenylcysteine O-methyltransferase Ste14